MQGWLPYLIGSVGLTVIIVLSHIAWPVRYWGCQAMRWLGLELPCPLYCSMCTGVWVGAAVGLTHICSSFGPLVLWQEPVRCALDVGAMAFSTSVVSYLATTWLRGYGEATTPEHDKAKIR